MLLSDVGIAIGAGTDVAIESASVIMLGDRLRDIAGALVLGRASYRTMQVNVALAVLANVIGIVVTAAGFITPMFAIAFILASIVAILANTLRIRTHRSAPWRADTHRDAGGDHGSTVRRRDRDPF